MNCYIHSQREATARCAECGNYICFECAVDLSGRTVCKSCAVNLASKRRSDFHRKEGRSKHSSYRCLGSEHRYPKPVRDLNGFFLFCLSAIPGLNYMYLGLMKRGLFFMSTFFLLIFLMAFFETPYLAFILLIEMFYAFFDSFKIRRDMLEGRVVNDDINDIEPFFRRNKGIIIMAVIFIIGSSSLRQLSRYFRDILYNILGTNSYWFFYRLGSAVMGLVVAAAGFYIIYRAFIKRGPDYRIEETDDRAGGDMEKFN